jgi:hypothetical protein
MMHNEPTDVILNLGELRPSGRPFSGGAGEFNDEAMSAPNSREHCASATAAHTTAAIGSQGRLATAVFQRHHPFRVLIAQAAEQEIWPPTCRQT